MTEYLDACESCMRRDVRPDSAIPDGAHGIVAGYRCPHCGHTWTCGWGVDPELVMPPEPVGGARLIGELFDEYVTAQIFEQAAVNRARKHLAKDGDS